MTRGTGEGGSGSLPFCRASLGILFGGAAVRPSVAQGLAARFDNWNPIYTSLSPWGHALAVRPVTSKCPSAGPCIGRDEHLTDRHP